MVLPRMSEEVAIELLTRARGFDAEGVSALIRSLDTPELITVFVDVTCLACLVLALASEDAGNDQYGSDLLRRVAVDYMAAAVAAT